MTQYCLIIYGTTGGETTRLPDLLSATGWSENSKTLTGKETTLRILFHTIGVLEKHSSIDSLRQGQCVHWCFEDGSHVILRDNRLHHSISYKVCITRLNG